MSDRIWLEITSSSNHVGFIISIVANSTLLILLLTKSNRMGSYKYLMIAFCVFSLFYTSVETFLRPIMHIYDNTIFIIQRKRFDYSTKVARIISSTYCASYSIGFTLIAIHFIYRFFSTCRPENIRFFFGSKLFYWFFATILIAISWGVIAYTFYPSTDRTDRSFNVVSMFFYNLDPSEVDYVAYNYYRTVQDENQLNPWNLLGVIHHTIVMVFSFITVFYCGLATWRVLQSKQTASDRTKILQKQLFQALVIQTIIPTFLMYFPSMMLVVSPFFYWNAGSFANITVVTVHLYPAFDPLILLFTINDFRRTLKHIFLRIFFLKTRGSKAKKLKFVLQSSGTTIRL